MALGATGLEEVSTLLGVTWRGSSHVSIRKALGLKNGVCDCERSSLGQDQEERGNRIFVEVVGFCLSLSLSFFFFFFFFFWSNAFLIWKEISRGCEEFFCELKISHKYRDYLVESSFVVMALKKNPPFETSPNLGSGYHHPFTRYGGNGQIPQKCRGGSQDEV